MPLEISNIIKKFEKIARSSVKFSDVACGSEKGSFKNVFFTPGLNLFTSKATTSSADIKNQSTDEKKSSAIIVVTKPLSTVNLAQTFKKMSGYEAEVLHKLQQIYSAFILPYIYISRKRYLTVSLKADNNLMALILVLENSKQRLKFKDFKQIVSQLLLGVFHLHTNDLAHRDLKSSNIYYTLRDGSFHIQVGDLDTVCIIKKNGNPRRKITPFASLHYSAPEILKDTNTVIDAATLSKLDLRSIDMFAVGKIIEELLAITELTETESFQLFDLIGNERTAKGLLAKEPAKRVKIEDLVAPNTDAQIKTSFFGLSVEAIKKSFREILNMFPPPLLDGYLLTGCPKNRQVILLLPDVIKPVLKHAIYFNDKLDNLKPMVVSSTAETVEKEIIIKDYNKWMLKQITMLNVYIAQALADPRVKDYHEVLHELSTQMKKEIPFVAPRVTPALRG